jgi:hypothetical protein
MAKQKNISIPLMGMNRSTGGHFLNEKQFPFQLNGRADTDEQFALTDEHSNILAVKFDSGFKFVGGKNHIIRNKTYIFLTNPTTKVSEIGCISNTTDFTEYVDTEVNDINIEPAPLEEQTQVEHQEYTTLLTDYCEGNNDKYRYCLGFDIKYPIIDIIIKEQNIGTKLFWTSTPGNKEFRYIELDNLEQYKVTGDDNCGNDGVPTCLDCDKIRVYKLYTELKTKTYNRSLGGNLKKGSYEILGAYSDQLGNEFTSYTSLTPIVPIWDEGNIIHEQEDNDKETNFSIKVELDNVDAGFKYYKIAVRYFTSKGVFTSFVSGIYTTFNKSIIVSDNFGEAINNNTLSLVKPFVERVDGATTSNNMLLLNGIKEREPINLQPVINLAGLGVQWMSFRAKEDLYSNADSYKYIGYNRDENVALAIDFGMKDGYRTDPSIFIPRPPTADELKDMSSGKDFDSITNIVQDCDGNSRTKKWQFYNTATETGACPASSDIETVSQQENYLTYTAVKTIIQTEGFLEIGKTYLIKNVKVADDFGNTGYTVNNLKFIATSSEPTIWNSSTEVYNLTDGIESIPADLISITPSFIDDFTNLKNYIEDNNPSCDIDPPYTSSPLSNICAFLEVSKYTGLNNVPQVDLDFCQEPVLDTSSEKIVVSEVVDEQVIYTNKKIEDYPRLRAAEGFKAFEEGPGNEDDADDKVFSEQYALRYDYAVSNSIAREGTLHKRTNVSYADSCSAAIELRELEYSSGNTGQVIIHPYFGVELTADNTTDETLFANALENKNVNPATVVTIPRSEIGGLSSGGKFLSKIHKGAVWLKINVSEKVPLLVEISRLLDPSLKFWRLGKGVDYYKNRNVRVHFFSNCSTNEPIDTYSYEDEDGIETSSLGSIYDLGSRPALIPISEDIINSASVTDGYIYMVIDLPLSMSKGLGEDGYIDTDQTALPIIDTGITIPTNSAFSVNVRKLEYSKIDVTFEEIRLEKSQVYNISCTYDVPILDDCKPVPYKYGELGYYESFDTYPDNQELFDSSNLLINKSNVTNVDFLSKLKIYKKNETVDVLTLSEDADFRCKNIRHYKLPDNKISPFIRSNSIASNSDSVISPLGFTIDGEVINNLLDIAVDNNLLTDKQREEIVDYKIYRSDSTLDRSVVGSGVVFNSKKYTVDGEDISYFNYPFNSLGKDKYFPDNEDEPFDKMQVISPEFDYFKPSLPNEMSLQGYMFGKSNTRVLPVDEHAKMVILGDKAKNLAKTLATLEVIAESALNLAATAEVWRFDAGFVFSANPVGVGFHIALLGIELFSGVVFRYGRYKLEWEKTFENLGAPYNFGYYTSSGSNYNYLKPLQTDGDRLRGLTIGKYLKSGMLNVSDTVSGKNLKLNNIDREELPFFSLGDYPIENISPEYLNFDNSSVNPTFSSQILSSEIGSHKGKSPEQNRNIASPYVAFKNYIPNQYGNIGSIKWIDTTYCIPIENTGICNGILGGDTFISRHSKKRKARLFDTDLLGSADFTPFPYKFNSNYGDNPKYYIDYKVNSEFTSGGKTFPSIFYDVEFDCNSSSNTFYVEPPGKFYLYNISYTNFLCETRVNTNFRNARKEPWEQFYPQNTDYELISQPSTVSLTRKENFYYNKAYLQTNILNTVFTLPDYYSKEDEEKKAYNKNTVIYSLPDVNENSITEPWLLYRPNDKATLESTYGNLIGLKSIESNQILMYFENALQLQNSVNQFTDGSTSYNADLGNGGMFAKRAMTLRDTDLGYGGSQSKHTLSCEFGHFHADAKRGQVFNYTGGNNLKEISRYSNEEPNGMDIWFKNHLPFKISKHFSNYTELDNAYNGVGLHWGYDSKYRRVLLTKKDYIPLNDCVEYIDGRGFVLNNTKCEEEEVVSCPEGYTYNEENDECTKEYTLINLCPEGYTYDSANKKCTKIETATPVFEVPEIGAIIQSTCTQSFGSFQIVGYKAENTYTFTPAIIKISPLGLVKVNPGTYTFTVTDVDNCTSNPSSNIVIEDQPAIIATATPSALTITEQDDFTILLESPSPNITFTWTVVQSGVTGASSGSGSTITQILTGAGTTIYSITPYNEIDGCRGDVINVPITTTSICVVPDESCTNYNLQNGGQADATFSYTNCSGVIVNDGYLGGFESTNICAITGSVSADGNVSISSGSFCGPTTPAIIATATPSALTVTEQSEFTIALTSNTEGTAFTWTVTQSGVTGAIAGSGDTITQTLTGAGTATYTVTPYNASLDCYGDEITVTIVAELAGIACGGSLTANGTEGYYEVNATVGSDTGQVTVEFDAIGIPDRIQLVWNGAVVADSLFVGDSVQSYITQIQNVTSLDKFLYDGSTFQPNGTIAVNYSSTDISDYSGTDRSNGNAGNQVGVVANYPTSSSLASDGNIKLTFNKTTAEPTQISIIVVGISGSTAWNITDLDCPT